MTTLNNLSALIDENWKAGKEFGNDMALLYGFDEKDLKVLKENADDNAAGLNFENTSINRAWCAGVYIGAKEAFNKRKSHKCTCDHCTCK